MKKLEKAEQDLSQKERVEAVVLRKQEILEDYPEIGDSEFSDMVDSVLNSEDLIEGVEDESQIMDMVEELIQETLTQRDIITVIREIDEDYVYDNGLIFSLSDQLKQNPDLDEEDVRDIIREIISPIDAPVRNDREKDRRILSDKARQGNSVKTMREQGLSTYELLSQQLLERKQEINKTPLYMR